MQLSAPTLPLDPVLAAGAPATMTAAPSGEAVVGPFSAILSDTQTAAAGTSGGRHSQLPAAAEQEAAMAAWLAANGGPVQTVPPTAAEWMPADAATLPAVPGAGVAGDVASSEAASSAEAIVAAAAGLPTLTGSAAQSAPGSVAAGSARASSPTQATGHVSFLPETAGSLVLPSTDADLSTPVADQPDTASVNGRFSPGTPTSDSTSMSARPEVAPADAARVTVASAGTDAARRAPAAVATSASANNPVSSAQPASEGERPVTEFSGEGMRLVEGREPREAALPVGARFAESGGATSAQTERAVTGLAKIAAQYQRAQDNGNEPAYAGEKKSQVAVKQSVDTSDPGLGINVAKPDGAMKNFAASPALAPALPERGAEAVAPVVAAPTVSAGEERTLFSADVAHVVRRSVESAVAAAEQFASGEKRAVTLQFSVSGVDLGVRVELRSGGVHTTFRTDSPELRAALAQEWQSFTAAQPTERPLRLAEPVFTSNGHGASTGSDASGSEQRGAGAREGQRTFEEFASARGAARPPAAAATTHVSVSPRPVAASLPGRLHTFA